MCFVGNLPGLISERVFATMIILVGGLQSLGSFCSRAPSKNARVMLSIFLFLILFYGRDISKTADPKMAKCVVIEKSCFWFLNFFRGWEGVTFASDPASQNANAGKTDYLWKKRNLSDVGRIIGRKLRENCQRS